MKFKFMILFLSITTSVLISANIENFGELIRSYGENRRKLARLSEQTPLPEQEIADIKNKLEELAAKLGTTRQELDYVPTDIEPE